MSPHPLLQPCRCKAGSTCATCAAWRRMFDALQERRAERLERLFAVAEQRGYVLAGAHLWMPRRGKWRPFQVRDLDYVEALVR